MLRQIPIAMVTRFADQESETRGLEAGATDFIAKPYRPAVLMARVRNLLRIKHENDQAVRSLSEHWQHLVATRVTDIVAAASDAILSLDSDGRIVLINSAACSLFDVATESVLGREASVSLPGAGGLMDWLAKSGPTLAGVRLSSVGACTEVLLRTESRSRLVEPTGFRIGNGDNRITTLLLRDVTERARAREVESSRLRAEAVSRAESMMLSYVAHEIGNPLNGVLGFAQLMASDEAHPLPGPPGEAPGEPLVLGPACAVAPARRARFEPDRSGRLRGRAGGRRCPRRGVAAVDAVAAQAEIAGVQVVLLGPECAAFAIADPGRLQQCLVNLLTNAVKCNRPDGTVEMSVVIDGGLVLFSVRDSGIGMSAEQSAHLFEPFNRLGRSQSDLQGAGLGLVISRLLSEAMGGSLGVESRLGIGSRFTLRLSLA